MIVPDPPLRRDWFRVLGVYLLWHIFMSCFSLWAAAVAVGPCVAGFSLSAMVFWCEGAKGGGFYFSKKTSLQEVACVERKKV